MEFSDTYRHRGMRRRLVQTLREKGICHERVLAAIARVPRHALLDNAFVEHVYQDKAFPIGEGQTISQPYTVARQTELLDPQPGQRVLEVGTGSGYQACVLLEMGVRLETIECVPALYERTRRRLPQLGYAPNFHLGDGTQGLPQRAPYDGILVTAGGPGVPPGLVQQLAIGGKLVMPVGDQQQQVMIRLTRTAEKSLHRESFGAFRFVPLKGSFGWKN